jgi:hypothetical protein
MHSQIKIIKKKSYAKKSIITLVAKKFNRYSKRLMNASRDIYSTPKYRAKEVKISTKLAHSKAKESVQKARWESIRSKQKKKRPKSKKK